METLTLLAQVACAIRLGEGKFTNAKEAKAKGIMSTGEDSGWAVLDGQTTFTEEDETLAQEALNFVRGYEGTNKYLLGLKKVAAWDDVELQKAEAMAQIIPAFVRNSQEALPEGYGANSKFVGTVGKEHNFRGVIAMAREYTGRFGKKQVISVLDKEGNVLVYFPSNKILPLKAGDSIRCSGTVKSHSEYEGVAQTVLTRAKFHKA